jgi:DNA repair protein RecN (Recombination protein N)
MLTRLHIRNYVLIPELEINFPGDLSVITGETGAGKSIIVGALGLILGERADVSALLDKDKKCIIEGFFQPGPSKTIEAFLAENELDEQTELGVRREINANGKSRTFINDTPVNLSQLQELSGLLVDLHQQFDTLELGKTNFQMEVLDALAGHIGMLDKYGAVYNDWQSTRKETERLKEQQLLLEKEADYNRFQFSELEEAGFRENELEEAEAELKLMTNAEGIKQALGKVYHGLQESETPVAQQLKVMLQQLNPYASYHPDLPVLLQRIQAAQVELQDIASDLDRIGNQVNYDPAKIEKLNERLSLGYKLQKKHGVNSTAELLTIQQQLQDKLQSVLNLGELIFNKETEFKEKHSVVVGLAGKLSAGRAKQVKPLEEKVNKLLAQVGMPNARLKIALEISDELNDKGKNKVEFLFDANRSGQFQPVRKVASGGELSRLMLCIKSLVAQTMDLPTLVFDEIDTGISGEAARQVGIIMKQLSSKRQVICITHQPQIAGKANAHFLVYKEIAKGSKDTVSTHIRLLTPDERITTIAKMLSGEKPTAAAIENAREMIMN